MTDQSVLAHEVDSLTGAKVLVVGDVMLDSFVTGDVERISPEAPIPVLRIKREHTMLGGAGNVIANMKALGAAPHFISVIGDDSDGAEIKTLLGESATLIVETGRRTALKTRYFAGSQQLLRTDKETAAPIKGMTSENLVEAATEALPGYNALVLSDYGKGVLSPLTIKRLIALAGEQGIPVIVDPKGSDFTRYAGASLLTPNRKELAEATQLPTGSDEEVVTACQALIHSCNVGAVLATRSQDGMTLVGAQRSGDEGKARPALMGREPSADARPATEGLNEFSQIHHLPAEAREVFDVSGAGDTVVAAVAAAVAGGVSLVDAAQLANVAAGIVVGKVGTAVVSARDLVHTLHRQEIASTETKVVALDDALDRVGQWRRRSLKVGFTNGCFDLLHPGHISLLRQARAACDRLIVGLNSDESVKRLKGDSRPVQSEASRGTVLASLETVDLVVIFAEDTPETLIKAIGPDVLVKGADYTVETVVGADYVQSYGGKIVLAQLEDGHSTTATIGRMNKG